MNRADAVETKKRLMELAGVTVDSTGRQVSQDGTKINMRYTGPDVKPHYRLHYVPLTCIGFPMWWVEGPKCTSHGIIRFASARKAIRYRATRVRGSGISQWSRYIGGMSAAPPA